MSKQTTPTVLELGPCKRCGKPVRVGLQRGVPPLVYETEPFCSATCAREHYGTSLPAGEQGRQRRGYVSKSEEPPDVSGSRDRRPRHPSRKGVAS